MERSHEAGATVKQLYLGSLELGRDTREILRRVRIIADSRNLVGANGKMGRLKREQEANMESLEQIPLPDDDGPIEIAPTELSKQPSSPESKFVEVQGRESMKLVDAGICGGIIAAYACHFLSGGYLFLGFGAGSLIVTLCGSFALTLRGGYST